MLSLALRRLLATVPIVILVTVLTFGLFALAPGDPAQVAAGGESATPEAVEAARQRLGLNDPFIVQYGRWLKNLARGNLGESFGAGVPVGDLIRSRLPVTLSVAAGAMIVALLVGLPAGVVAALRAGRRSDTLIIAGATFGIALPEFVSGSVLILFFALQRHWFPATGYVPLSMGMSEWARSLLLPWLTLGLVVGAIFARHVRAAFRDVLDKDYVRAAQSKGLSAFSVLFKHAGRNAAMPIVTVIGVQFQRLLGGTVVVEYLFNLPGTGALLVRSVFSRDLPVLLGVATISALMVLIVNLLVDLSYLVLNPKVRSA